MNVFLLIIALLIVISLLRSKLALRVKIREIIKENSNTIIFLEKRKFKGHELTKSLKDKVFAELSDKKLKISGRRLGKIIDQEIIKVIKGRRGRVVFWGTILCLFVVTIFTFSQVQSKLKTVDKVKLAGDFNKWMDQANSWASNVYTAFREKENERVEKFMEQREEPKDEIDKGEKITLNKSIEEKLIEKAKGYFDSIGRDSSQLSLYSPEWESGIYNVTYYVMPFSDGSVITDILGDKDGNIYIETGFLNADGEVEVVQVN